MLTLFFTLAYQVCTRALENFCNIIILGSIPLFCNLFYTTMCMHSFCCNQKFERSTILYLLKQILRNSNLVSSHIKTCKLTEFLNFLFLAWKHV